MKHLDLFSGIGGAALAVDRVFPGSEHVFCEIDPFCQAVLKKHYPNSYIHGDIRTFKKEIIEKNEKNWSVANTDIREGRPGIIKEPNEKEILECCTNSAGTRRGVDILTGGFPCQPFSQAGRRKGTADNRHLWPEMFRVIKEFHPRWVLGENVGGFVTWGEGMVLEQVCLDLEGEGYQVQPFIIPACALNAPHRRDRVWIVAKDTKHHRGTVGENEEQGDIRDEWNIGTRNDVRVHIQEDATNPTSNRRKRRGKGIEVEEGHGARPEQARKLEGRLERPHSDAPNTKCRGSGASAIGSQEGWRANPIEWDGHSPSQWSRDWLEVATTLCRVDDGLSDRLVRLPNGETITHAKWRKEALRGLGNAWVPAVAVEILKGIKEVDQRSL